MSRGCRIQIGHLSSPASKKTDLFYPQSPGPKQVKQNLPPINALAELFQEDHGDPQRGKNSAHNSGQYSFRNLIGQTCTQ